MIFDCSHLCLVNQWNFCSQAILWWMCLSRAHKDGHLPATTLYFSLYTHKQIYLRGHTDGIVATYEVSKDNDFIHSCLRF